MNKYAAMFVALCVPMMANAQVVITEVMYDLPGNDTGREWVEIHNTSETAVDISDWRFFEQETNHRLQHEEGATLAPDDRAIIADDVAAFKKDNPQVAALILNSAFSLKNTGEYMVLKNAEGDEVDVLAYTPQADANGEGASLQRFGDTWEAYAPTPGKPNKKVAISTENKEKTNAQNTAAGNSEEDSAKRARSSRASAASGANTENTTTQQKERNNSSSDSANVATKAGPDHTATQTSKTTVIETQNDDSSLQWLLGVIALTLLAAAGIVYIRYKELHGSHVSDPEAAREARNYEIIEETDK